MKLNLNPADSIPGMSGLDFYYWRLSPTQVYIESKKSYFLGFSANAYCCYYKTSPNTWDPRPHNDQGPTQIYFKNNQPIYLTYYLDGVRLTKAEWSRRTGHCLCPCCRQFCGQQCYATKI